MESVLDDVDAGDPQTIMVLGSDRRWGDTKAKIKPRSDTIILVRLDPSKGATAILSIPRDLKVNYTTQERRRPTATRSTPPTRWAARARPSRKVKELMGGEFPIHHVVNINFGAFTRAVKRLGCFYVDVDRRYFNDNKPPVQSPTNYATIDLKPGYQKLCGQDSLDFVRFRHLDTDIVRGARQQHYLSAAKDQLGVERLFRDRKELLELFGRYTDTDIRSSAAVLRLLKLTYESSRDPLRRVKFDAELGQEFVTISDAKLAQGPRGVPQRRGVARRDAARRSRARGSRRAEELAQAQALAARVPGTDAVTREVEDNAILAATKLPFPVYYPKLVVRGGRFYDGFSSNKPRTYDLFGEDRKRYRAMRIVVEAPGHRRVLRHPGHELEEPADARQARPRRARSTGASSSSTATAAACASSRGRRRRRPGGSPTRCCAR